MEVQFKVYAYLGALKPEVRRFTIDRSVVTNYQYLIAKLEDVFPALRGRKYSVAWKDEEGDDIRISSDSELVTALNSGGEINKLYIEAEDAMETGDNKTIEIDMTFVPPPAGEGDAEAAEAAEAAELHYGVECDGCQGTVVGYRYRCTVCRDFDLCMTCEAAGKHPQHCMLRIPSPLTPSHVKTKIKRTHHMKAMFSKEYCSDRKPEDSQCPYLKKQKRDKGGEHHGHHRRHGEHRTRGGWMDTVAAYMNEFANLAGDVASGHYAPAAGQSTAAASQCTPAAGQSAPTAGQSAPTAGQSAPAAGQSVSASCQSTYTAGQSAPQTSTNAENGETIPPPTVQNGTQAAPTPSNTPSETGEVPVLPPIQLDKLLNPENLKYVLEIQKKLASILLPTLVSESAMENPGVQTQTETPNRPASEVASTSHVGSQTPSEASSQTSSRADDGTDKVASTERQESTPERADGWTMINNDSDLMDMPVPQPAAPTAAATAAPTAPVAPAGAAAVPTAPAQPIGFKDLPRNFNEQLKLDETPKLYPNIAANNTSTSYTVSGTGATAIPLPPPNRPFQSPQQPQPPAARRPHPKPHIEAAIIQMLAMGFTDEGGWLTQLVESKDGNISAVIDLLTPVKVQRP